MSERNVAALQAAVLSCLTDILSCEQQKIKTAEAELKALEVTEEYGEVLASLTVSDGTPVQFRQLACIILKQYVERHWSEESEKYTEPIPGPQTKARIRKLLPKGLGDNQSRIRATVAYAISAIAHWDWPEEWPDLFDQLMTVLASGDQCLVHGCMRVLQEFCHDVTDQQMSLVAPIIFPQLLKVFAGSQVHGVRTRTRVVHIFSVLCGLIFTMADVYPEAPKTLLFPILPDYLAAFVHVLGSSDEQSTDPGLRKELIMALCNLVRSFPHTLLPHIMEIVTPVWTILVTNTPHYVRSVVNATECLAEVSDSDGDIITYQGTVFAIFEFISSLIESTKLQKILVPILPELMYYIVAHLQITEEQVHTWLNDVNQFVNEDDNEFSYSVRLSALDLINSLCEEPAIVSSCHSAVVAAVQRHLQETPHGKGSWWKIHEACFLTIGSVFGQAGFEGIQFDFHAFVERILLPDLISDASPLLTGRCLWLGAKLASMMTPDALRRLLEATGLCLQSSQHAVVRILATKAAYHFSTTLASSQLLRECLPMFLGQLVQLASQCPDDVMPVVLDALCQVARADKDITGQFTDRLVPLTMELFKKYSHDPGVSTCVEELFATMATTPACWEGLHSRFLPTAVHILQSPEAQLPAGILCATLDMAALLIRGCDGGLLPEVLMAELFPAAVQSILRTDDSAVIQSGGECIRAFISTAPEYVSRWVDPSGRTGLYYVVQVILHMLDPSRPEFTASFVGKLLVVFVKRVGSCLGQYLELLLKAVLSKMQLVQTSTVMQSLLCVFAHLIQHELEAVVTFLLGIPDPSGQPALCFVLNQWCAGHSFFFGVYETRISTMALCKLLHHCLTVRDSRLAKVSVRVEEGAVSEAIFTRSRKAVDGRHVTTEMPLPVRLMKLVIADLQLQVEAKQAGNPGEGEWVYVEYEDGDGEEDGWEDAMPHSLEALLGTSGCVGYEGQCDEEEEDPDLKDEAVLQIDMESHLTQCLRDLSYTPSFTSVVSMLADHERQTLHSIGIQYK